MANWLVHNKLYTWLAVGWTLLIIYLCLESTANLPQIKVFGLDKISHIVVHFIFTILWFISFINFKISFKKAIIAAVSFSVIFGISIEILQQLLTSTRHADILDVAANATGAILATFLANRLKKNILI